MELSSEFYLREMTEADELHYLETVRAEGGSSNAESQAVFLQFCLQTMVIYSVVQSQTDAYMGYVLFRRPDSETPEIGVALLPEYQGRGIGGKALQTAAKRFAEKTGVHSFLIRVKVGNDASRKMIEKLNAERLEDEDDGSLTVVRKLMEKLPPEEAEKLLADYQKDYHPEQEMVLQYRYQIEG